jgi:hypothetical protein
MINQIDLQGIPEVSTPRLPAEEEEENEFLKPSDLATKSRTYITQQWKRLHYQTVTHSNRRITTK